MRLFFIGDSFVNGVGDAEGLGWRGRVTAAALKAGLDVTAYDLGIRRNTSGDIRARWEAETTARLPAGLPHRLLFAFGTNDCADDGTGRRRLTLADTLANAETILDKARRQAPTLMIGPPPILDDGEADARIAELEKELGALCAGLDVPFLPVLGLLQQHEAWTRGARDGDGTHPDAEGYALLAREILAWPAFRAWIGLNRLQGNQR
jgi:acyl-CoA thioesterase-1